MIDSRATLQAGDLIIAPPAMKDPRFSQSVIMLTSHSAQSSYGLVLNKVTEHAVADLVKDEAMAIMSDIPLYWGGPVSPTTVWMLHSNDWAMSNTIMVNDYWSITSNPRMFHTFAEGMEPQEFRVFYGFASWASGQLESEIQGEYPWTPESSWLLWHRPYNDEILNVEADQLWNVATGECAQQAVNNWLA
jgi:putative transcriptional regulator